MNQRGQATVKRKQKKLKLSAFPTNTSLHIVPWTWHIFLALQGIEKRMNELIWKKHGESMIEKCCNRYISCRHFSPKIYPWSSAKECTMIKIDEWLNSSSESHLCFWLCAIAEDRCFPRDNPAGFNCIFRWNPGFLVFIFVGRHLLIIFFSSVFHSHHFIFKINWYKLLFFGEITHSQKNLLILINNVPFHRSSHEPNLSEIRQIALIYV